MQFDHMETRSILLRQTREPIEIRYRGRTLFVVPSDRAAKMCQTREDLWGVGNCRRIRYLTVGPQGHRAEDSSTTDGNRAEQQDHNTERCRAYGPQQTD